ncbi:hypothetical protein P171DRAFT_519409 [Karstenula rhodostoma CBS 690.94]|uniref:Uncharacterized protein n=1 Tax=Karstenula rhodostoma CBS 690.94 TaxID=1392251 RepID=A0A9P4PL48_9PLEO|nr:hypothetical protein P171DRAFT_519409 [Karstenula rhodostoma CBS 690.94]
MQRSKLLLYHSPSCYIIVLQLNPEKLMILQKRPQPPQVLVRPMPPTSDEDTSAEARSTTTGGSKHAAEDDLDKLAEWTKKARCELFRHNAQLLTITNKFEEVERPMREREKAIVELEAQVRLRDEKIVVLEKEEGERMKKNVEMVEEHCRKLKEGINYGGVAGS